MNKITKYILLTPHIHKAYPSTTPLVPPLQPLRKILYSFSKKHQLKKTKKYEYDPSKIKPKSEEDYINLPENLKKNVVQVRHMLTPSEANVEAQTLKEIIIQQRTLLQRSLKQQIEKQLSPVQAKPNQTRISKLVNKYMVAEQLNKYYILRPLKYLQSLYFNLFIGNMLGLGWFQYINDYNTIGWFFGYYTSPVAATALAILVGYNFSFWIVRQIFHIHLPLNAIKSSDISLISTTWRNIFQLAFISLNFSALIYSLSFGFTLPIYKTYIIMAFLNFMHLGLNLYEILKSLSAFHKVYVVDFIRIISTMTLLILLFGIYSVQIASSERLEESIDSVEYRHRVTEIGKGHKEFLNFFKQKKYQMKQSEKINPIDEE